MKGLLSGVLIFLAVAAHAQLPWPTTHSASSRFTALDVAVDGDLIWTAGGWGLRLQRADGGAPASGTTIPIPGLTTRVAAAGNRAFVGSGDRLFTVRADETPVVEHMLAVGGWINDLLLVGPYLYAATTAGVVQLDVLQPSTPAVTRSLSTSAGGALALAQRGNRLFAADGDISVEIYDISFPALAQRVGSFNAFPQTTSVHAAGDLLVVSDGRQTRLYTSGAEPILVGSLPGGSDAAALVSADILATAEGRQLSLWNIGAASDPVLLWRGASPVTPGSVNRISAVAVAGDVVLAAAGEAGLMVVGLEGFVAPYPIESRSSAPVASLAASGTQVITGGPEGGMTLWRRTDSGLERRNIFDTARVSVAADLDGGRLLSFSGATLSLWNAAVTPPAPLASVDMEAAIRGAVLRDTTAWAILSNGSAVTVDFAQSPPAVAPWDPGVTSPYALARGGDDIGVVGLAGSGTSSLRIHRIGQGAGTAVSFAGAATGGIALDGSGRAALVTFAGLHLISPETNPPVRVVADVAPVQDIAWGAGGIVLVREDALEIRSPSDGSFVRSVSLPALVRTAAAVAGTDEIVAGGESALVLVRTSSVDSGPADLSVAEGNRYPREISRESGTLYVRENDQLTSLRIGRGGALVPMVSVPLPQGVLDTAVAGGDIWTLSSSATLSRLSWGGVSTPVASLPADADLVPLSLTHAAGALYVSYRRGCSVGVCEKKTDVFDAATGQLSTSLDGELLDISVDGDVAYALFDSPREIRRLDLRDPLRPVVTASRELAGSPVSVAWRANDERLFVLGSRLDRLDPQNLLVLESYLEPWTVDPSGRLSYTDQRVRISSSGLAIAGRWFAPRFWPGADPGTAPLVWDVPAASRRIVPLESGWILLTDSSIEVAMPPVAGRSRGVRR